MARGTDRQYNMCWYHHHLLTDLLVEALLVVPTSVQAVGQGLMVSSTEAVHVTSFDCMQLLRLEQPADGIYIHCAMA
jgi:hypothetical protein